MKTNQKMNKTKLGVFITMLLIVAYVAPLCMGSAGTGVAAGSGAPSGAGKYPDVPGAPDNAVQYNKTDVTPVAETARIAAGEPVLFQYRNLTMLMNCSRNCEVVFTVDPEVTPKILGLSVEPTQNMTLTINMYRSPLQGEQVMERTLNFYLGIEPNAKIELKAQIRLHINQGELNQELNRVVNASRLTWMYWNQTQMQWKPVTSFMDQNGYLVCNTNHFSTWTVAEVGDSTEPVADTLLGGVRLEYVLAVVVAVLVVVVGIVAFKRRK